MKSIESYMFYGDNAKVFQPLIGFKIVDIQLTHANEENDDVVILKCVNEHNVAIDILFQEDVVSVTEPYAVNEDLSPIESKQEKEEGVAPVIEQENTHTKIQEGK